MSFNILTTKRATQTLKEMEIDISEFNGNPQITLHLEKSSIDISRPHIFHSFPVITKFGTGKVRGNANDQ